MKTIREISGHLVSDPYLRWCTLASIIFFFATVFVLVWKIVPLSSVRPFIPLHYNIYFGVDQFGPWQNVFVLPAIGFVFILMNSAIEGLMVREGRLLAYFFAFCTVILEAFLFISSILLILLNV